MGEKRNYAALEWVIGEIGDALNEARQALEAYVEDARDETRIRFCLTHIHQVLGSLKMVEFHGAALFAEEMELLAQAIIGQTVVNEKEAQEVLMRSLLQLPIYLDHVKRIQDDHPGIVLPLLNDLRAARKESYLSETNLFTPELAPLTEAAGKHHPLLSGGSKLKEVLKKLFEMYQYAAASVLRGIKIEENLAYVKKVFSRLEGISAGTSQGNLWFLASALVDSLAEDEIELSAAVKGLLRRLAKEIKRLYEHPREAFDAPVDPILARNLLYYIARSGDVSPRITKAKELYGLKDALFEGGVEGRDFHKSMISAPEPDTIRSVVSALRDEMNAVKQILTHVVTNKVLSGLEASLPIVKRVADTLAVLGVADLRHATNTEHERLEKMCQLGELDETVLADIANELVTIEHRMDAVAKSAGKADIAALNERDVEIDEAKEVVLTECRAGLEKLKSAIVEFYSSQWDRSALSGAEAVIKDIRGGLGMVPLERAAAIVTVCGTFIQEKFISDKAEPNAEELTALANAVEGVDYYLDRLVSDFTDDVESFLELSEDALQELGYKVPSTASNAIPFDSASHASANVEPEEVSPVQASEEAVVSDPVTASEPFNGTESSDVLNVGENSDEVSPVTKPTDGDALATGSSTTQEPPEDENLPETDSLTTSVSESRDGEFSSPASADAQVDDLAQADEKALETFELDESVDEDIAEIFVEEAREVLETLSENLPHWPGDTAEGEPLSVIRRSFHTLKGSGRMVKAGDISELAWSVENMLNRVIDKSVDVTPLYSEFTQKVFTFLPDLVDAFEGRYISPKRSIAQTYEEWANSLSEGTVPEALLSGSSIESSAETTAEAFDESEQNSLATVTDIEGLTEGGIAGDGIADDGIANGTELTGQPSSVETEAAEGLVDKGFADQESVDVDEDKQEESILWELFASEAQTHLSAIDEFIAHMEQEAPIYTTPTDSLQRALHTLKGSAHMAGVSQIALMAAPLEIFVKELRIYHVAINDDILQLIRDSAAYTREGLSYVERNEQAHIAKLDQFIARVAELKELHLGHLVRMTEAPDAGAPHPVDPRMLAIFMAEDIRLLLDADEVLERWQADIAHTSELPAMMAELKTLESGAEQANFPPMAKLSGQLHNLYEATLDHLAPDSKLFETFYAAHNSLLDMIDAVAAAQALPSVPEHLQQILDGYLIEPVVVPEPVVDLGSSADLGPSLDVNPDDIDITPTQGYSEEDDALDLTHVEEGNSDNDQGVDEDELSLAVGDDDFFNADSLESSLEETVEEPEPVELHEVASPEDVPQEQEVSADTVEPALATHQPASPVNSVFTGGDPSHIDSDDFDAEIIEIFLEEADELIEELEEAIHEWESDWESTAPSDAMKRALHTLKGGARLSNLSVFGELTHEYETYLVNNIGPGKTSGFFSVVHQYQDLALKGIKGVRARLAGEELPDSPAIPAAVPPVVDMRTETEAPQLDSIADQLPPMETVALGTNNTLSGDTSESTASTDHSELLVPDSSASEVKNIAPTPKKTSSQEVVKISSELLEELVNLAGETSISRGRLEQQVSDFGTAIGEIDITLSRLQEQLRRLDMETEAQIVFRQEQLAEDEEFDPLEMDRYSQLQQLSRSLTESASDLVDLKRTLSDKVKDTEAILLQQQRINSSLQEGLMRARMVPFSRMVPRLRRIVRQVATELTKQVSFELDNVDGEMDRSVLEHMVAPLEHMLRNAVDHGVETPAERLAAGKPESGRILLSFSREGGDILLRLADDGRGIALEKVRQKAIERGLMAEDADLSDHDIMQFILQAGFSTVDNVTQISGRGVGMDVVAAEIKQLGGSMTIESKPGVGTQFTVRLPFTVSVNRALMVMLGKESFAIPLNTIEGIVRVSPFELEHYYSQDEAKFEYAGESYDVRYLGSMLYDDMQPRLEGQVMPLPVILVRSAQHTMALQVDALMGSREIVVKSLGSQFASVQGLSGATVMGDGSVVIILDPHALVRRAVATTGLTTPVPVASLEREHVTKTVMVVDDSVTVRKVTTRFLEREGFNVITAKDGVDALQVLQGRIPDVMLLDIEMPRMDGFEVAKNMRTSEEWADIPIIMITSRTGGKHREHALSIGVNHYLGKPYQEELLLESINELLGI